MEAVEALIQVIFSFSSEEQRNKLQSSFLSCLEDKGLPALDLSSNMEGLELEDIKLNENDA